ncbi:hypothetical protein FJY69_03295 [candidate division WOR-3 bacterium]|nr:hypothetical protein [candidate division WOR-3 bacterium]
MKSLYVLLGDVMSSAEAHDRTALQRRLSAACRAGNAAAGQDLFAPLKPLKGVDEVGGALRSARRACDVLCAFNDAMRLFRARFVLVHGGVDMGLATRDAARLDGPAFVAAAELMLQLKKSGLPFASALDGRGLDAGIAGLFNVLLTMRWSWTERQRAGMTAYQATGSQQAAAERVGVSQQAVSKALRSVSWRVYRQAEESLRMALASLDKADLQEKEAKR